MRMSEHPLLAAFVGKPLVLDSNLLILRWCMQVNPSLIRSFKRLSSFQPVDAEGLEATLEVFSSVKTTPHVLTEISNLANQLPEWIKDDWTRNYVHQVKLVDEIYTPSSEVVSDPIIRLGLTDAALVSLASSHVILTVDFPLSNYLSSRSLNGINFTHLRSIWLT